MRFPNRFLLLLITASLFTVQSCRKDNNPDNNNVTGFDNSKTVQASIYGIVEDESGNAVNGASVKLGGNTTTTDANGLFFFSNVTTPERASTVVVSKSGYFNGSRTLFVQANGKHTVRIRLMEKGVPQTFNAVSGGVVNFNSINITFPANGIVNKATGAPYNGTVSVYAKNIDPTTDEGRASMPGDLRGIGTDGNEKVMESFGMIVAELYDVSGNALQVANGSEATLALTVPLSLQGNTPATIPLWYFDETKGMWIEEGSATLQGNTYTGTVTHFSFWNWDIPFSAIIMELTLVDQNSNPLQEYKVIVYNPLYQNYNNTVQGYTNAAGWAGGPVPASTTLVLKIYKQGSVCGTPILVHTQNVTTGTSHMNLGTIVVNSQPSATINATTQDCNGNVISNAPVLLQPLGVLLSSDASGNIAYTFPCTPTSAITLVAYDLINSVSGSSTHTLTSGVNNLGAITACGTLEYFVKFTLTNTVTSASESRTFVAPIDTVGHSYSISCRTIKGVGNGSSVYIRINGMGTGGVGTHNLNSPVCISSVNVQPSSLPDQQFDFNSVTGSITYTQFSGDVVGYFSAGNIKGNTTNNTYTLTGNFRVQ